MENGVVSGRMSVKRGRGTWNGEWCGVWANECEERARNVEWCGVRANEWQERERNVEWRMVWCLGE